MLAISICRFLLCIACNVSLLARWCCWTLYGNTLSKPRGMHDLASATVLKAGGQNHAPVCLVSLAVMSACLFQEIVDHSLPDEAAASWLMTGPTLLGACLARACALPICQAEFWSILRERSRCFMPVKGLGQGCLGPHSEFRLQAIWPQSTCTRYRLSAQCLTSP